MGTPSLLNETGFHQLASRFLIHKVRQRLLDASRRAEMLCRARALRPNPLDSKKYLNRYEFRPNRPIVIREGRLELTELEFVYNTIDLSFVRHLCARYYRMRNWQPIHDPVNLYKIHLWISAENLYHQEATELLLHKRLGREARELLDLKLEEVPKTYTVLTRFLERVGDEGLWQISEMFFWILAEADFFAAPEVFLAGDSQLVPSFSRFRGCNQFCGGCKKLELSSSQLRDALVGTLEKVAGDSPRFDPSSAEEHRHRVAVACPFGATSQKGRRKLDVGVGWLRLFEKNRWPRRRDDAETYEVTHPLLEAHGLGFKLEGSPLRRGPEGYELRCPRLPSDTTARIGWKNGNQPDADPIPVFGADLEQLTFRLPELGLELPFGVLGAHGNAQTRLASLLGVLDDVPRKVKPIAAAFDARYDTLENYQILRGRGIVPLIDLIHHKGEDSPEVTAKRGITMQGVPLARCGVPMKSNGFDYDAGRRAFTCGHQKPPEICAQCPFGPHAHKFGQIKKVSVAQYPRYVLEIPRDSVEYGLLFDHRTAAERTHADVAETALKTIVRPRLRGVRKIAAKACFAHHHVLWRRIFYFIDDINKLRDVAGLYLSAVDEAVAFWGTGSLHALKPALVEACKPSHFG